MANGEYDSEFHALVRESAGSDEKGKQVSYLVKVVRKVMKKRYMAGWQGLHSAKFEDVTPAQEDMLIAWRIQDAFYTDVAKMLLDDPGFDRLDIRTGVIREMQKILDGVR